MNDPIIIAVVVAMVFGGTVAAEKIFVSVRAAHSLKPHTGFQNWHHLQVLY